MLGNPENLWRELYIGKRGGAATGKADFNLHIFTQATCILPIASMCLEWGAPFVGFNIFPHSPQTISDLLPSVSSAENDSGFYPGFILADVLDGAWNEGSGTWKRRSREKQSLHRLCRHQAATFSLITTESCMKWLPSEHKQR